MFHCEKGTGVDMKIYNNNKNKIRFLVFSQLFILIIFLFNGIFPYTVKSAEKNDKAVLEEVIIRIFEPDQNMIQMYDNWQAMQEAITASKWNGTQAFPVKEMEAFNDYFTVDGYDSFVRQRLSMTCFEALKSGCQLSLKDIEISKDKDSTGHYTFRVYIGFTGKNQRNSKLCIEGKAFFDETSQKISYIHIDKSNMLTALY